MSRTIKATTKAATRLERFPAVSGHGRVRRMPTIELTADGGHVLSAYRADPAGTPRAAVVVIQEIFGVNNHIRRVVDRFAHAGYVTIAPAIFDRKERGVELAYDPSGLGRGRALAMSLDLDDTMRDVRAACAAVASAGKIGSVGYCFGGSVAWLTASRIEELSCAVCYYGSRIPNFIDEAPRIPTMLHVGLQDASFPMEEVRRIGARYPTIRIEEHDAQHGFNCDERGSYDAAAAAKALEQTLAFFAEQLG
jgi:carboxymethylenebutenolidase